MTTVELLTLVIAAVPVPVTVGIYLARVRRHDKEIDALDERMRAVEKTVENTRRIEEHETRLRALEVAVVKLSNIEPEINMIRDWKHHEIGPLIRVMAAQVSVLLSKVGVKWPPSVDDE